MKQLTINLFALGVGCWLFFLLNASVEAHSNYESHIVKYRETTQPHKEGFWARKTGWKSTWVKYWQEKKIYVPIWKKVWSPIVQNEWVPLPNAPVAGGSWAKSH